MSTTLLSSLPGDIPGLRRDGTVMRHAHYGRGVAFSDLRGQPIILTADGRCLTLLEGWEVDLSDPAARSDAAIWASGVRLTRNERYLCIHALLSPMSLEWTDEDTDVLARLVLRLAGRTA